MISKASKERVIKRLQQENARSPYLNSLPGKVKSYSKLDQGEITLMSMLHSSGCPLMSLIS